MKFEDTSSYSRNDTDREPREFTARAGWLRISVHRHIHYPKDVWLLSTSPGLIDNYELCSKPIAMALREAVRVVRTKLAAVMDDLPKD